MATAALPRGTKNGSKPDVVLDRDAEPPVGATGAILQVPIDLIDVGDNVRVTVDEIEELAASIRERGVLQPIKVRDAAGDRYLVTWGQRRLLAAKLAGFDRIPAIVDNRVQTPAELAIEQLVENLARQDLPPLERARAMRAVVDAGRTQADLARELGLAPSTVTNDLGLLEAPAKIRDAIDRGELAPAHAKALKGLPASTQAELAAEVVRRGLSAHATEELVQEHKRREEWQAQRQAAEHDAAAAQAERYNERLAELARKVALDTPIRVSGYSYGGADNLKTAEERIRAAGFTKVTRGRAESRAKGFCDCTAWKVEVGYNGGLSIGPACIVDAHYAAKQKADRVEFNAKQDLEKRVRERLAEVLVAEVSQLGPLATRIAMWRMLGWQIDDWTKHVDANRPLIEALDDDAAAKRQARKKRDPWATLTELDTARLRTELAGFMAKDLRDGNFKVDWPALAAELGLVEAEERPVEKRAPA